MWCNTFLVDSPLPYLDMSWVDVPLSVGSQMDKQHSCGCQLVWLLIARDTLQVTVSGVYTFFSCSMA